MLQAKIILFVLLSLGTGIAWLYGYKTKGFHWDKYAAFVALPLLAIVWYAVSVDLRILLFFAIAMAGGTIAELVLGFFLEQSLGAKLWQYPRFSVAGYTSFLSIPIWGFAGTMFWLLASFVGFH